MVVTEVQRGWVTHPRSHSESAPVLDTRLPDAMCTRIVSDISSGLAAVLVLPYNRTHVEQPHHGLCRRNLCFPHFAKEESESWGQQELPPQITELGDGPEPGF